MDSSSEDVSKQVVSMIDDLIEDNASIMKTIESDLKIPKAFHTVSYK